MTRTSLTAAGHQKEAERLLLLAKQAIERISSEGPQLTQDMEANLHVNDQVIAMAHVHALLARR